MIVLKLLIAHLLGDFVFQSNSIYKKKYESWLGTLNHVLIIIFFTILILIPFLNRIEAWIAIFSIFFAHFIQDLLKVAYDKKFNLENRSVLPFFADQFGHIALICILGFLLNFEGPIQMPNWLNTLYFSQTLDLILIAILLVTYTLDITFYQFKRRKDKKLNIYHPDHERMWYRLMSFIIFTLILVLVLRLNLFT